MGKAPGEDVDEAREELSVERLQLRDAQVELHGRLLADEQLQARNDVDQQLAVLAHGAQQPLAHECHRLFALSQHLRI